MDMKKKLEKIKQKIKFHAPEIIAFSAVALPIIAYVVYLSQQNPPAWMVLDEENDHVKYGEMSSTQMAKMLKEGSMIAYKVDDSDPNFYTISDSTE